MTDKILSRAIQTSKTFGFSVFPVHGTDEFGICTCGDSACNNVGKHPATSHGLKDASKDADVITNLWAKRQGLNYGIATGQESGVFVVDLDGAAAGTHFKSLGLQAATLTAKTARGKHLFFKYPDFKVKTARGMLGHDKIDIRGAGGYVVGAGSNHASGAVYEWVNELESIEPAPQWLLDKLQESDKPKQIIGDSGAVLNLGMQKPILSLGNDFTLDDIQDMLAKISPDIGYDEWINIGMALHHAGHPFSVWDGWSSGGGKYVGNKDTATHWRSFKQSGGVSLGSLVHHAKAAGWQPKRLSVPPMVKPEYVPVLQTEQFDPVTGEIDMGETVTPSTVKPLNPSMFYIKACDVKPSLDCMDFVQGVLADQQMSVVYGESNCGKTFFMADLSFHVALGKEWRGKRVEQGGVIYTALEGGRGFSNRVSAYCQHNLLLGNNMPLGIVPCAVDFMSKDGNISEYIDMIKRAKDDIGAIRLVVVDTLARAIAGGDENSGQDMGMIVHHADLIRYETGAHVAFIHHSGKDKARGARGHSSLRAAVDTEIEISRDDGADFSTIKFAKQREMEIGEDMAFQLQGVVLGQNRYGEDVTSCVVMPYENNTKEKTKARLTPRQDFVYRAILEAVSSHGFNKIPVAGMPEVKTCTHDDLRGVLDAMGYARMVTKEGEPVGSQAVKSSTQAARIELQKKGYIGFTDRYLWVL
jgi:hypothetical protein